MIIFFVVMKYEHNSVKLAIGYMLGCCKGKTYQIIYDATTSYIAS